MPSFVTHDYFASKALAHAPEELAALCRKHRSAYTWGAQGFDPLCYRHAPCGGSEADCGRALHHTPPFPLFQALLPAAKQPPARAWLLGLCTHYLLYRALAPLIDAVARERLAARYPDMTPTRLANLCATGLDYAVAVRYITPDPSRFAAYRLLPVRPVSCRTPAQMLALCAAQLGQSISPHVCAGAMRDMRRVHEALFPGGDHAWDALFRRETRDGQPGQLSSLKPRSIPLPVDFANTSHSTWHDANGSVHTEDAFALLEQAQDAMLPLWMNIWQACTKDTSLDPDFFDRDFCGRPVPGTTPHP